MRILILSAVVLAALFIFNETREPTWWKTFFRYSYATLFIITAVIITTSLPSKNLNGARVKASPNFIDGKAKNLVETPLMTKSDNSTLSMLFSNGGKPELVPSVKTDLKSLDIHEELMVWLGHSSILIQTEGRRILVDPVLSEAGSPLPFINKPFAGTEIYTPGDIPAIDFLIITHDHYDHLSKKTVRSIKDRVGKVICPLGVGRYFRDWGYPENKIVEMDWDEEYIPDDNFTIYCLPARHFSGRGLFSQRSTLWASYMLKTREHTIYFGGDSGYEDHFKTIGKRFGSVDLAFLENGQYNEQWRYVHMTPSETLAAAKDINARRLMPIHNSKYKLAPHAWDEPLKSLKSLSNGSGIILMTPLIGEKVPLWDEDYVYQEWWIKSE